MRENKMKMIFSDKEKTPGTLEKKIVQFSVLICKPGLL